MKCSWRSILWVAPGRRRDAEEQFPWTAKCEHLRRAAGWDFNFRLQRIPLKKSPQKKEKATNPERTSARRQAHIRVGNK